MDIFRRLAETGSHDDGNHTEDGFQHLYVLLFFLFFSWICGKGCSRLGMPTLIGEMIVGIVFGPQLIDLIPFTDALIVIGELGLSFAVLEAGIDVDIGTLKLIGFRGLIVALFGSCVPFLMGMALAYILEGSFQTSLAIGACFASTSMGVALNVLKSSKMIDTPIGQLIIAAAILDDVAVLILLSEIQAMKNPTAINILLPLFVSPVLILLFGYVHI